MALPTATCLPFAAAMPLTASWGSKAPGIAGTSTCSGAARVARTVISGWRLSGSPVVVPAVTTTPPAPTATPVVACDAALPYAGVGRHETPSAEEKAVRVRPACPVTAAPSGPPSTMPTTKPSGVPRVAANVQAVPSGER